MRKKILLLSSYGGYGHIAAAKTMEAVLGDQYEFDTVYPIREMRILGIPRAESLYNFCLKNNLIKLTNWVVRRISAFVFHLGAKKIERLLAAHIEEKKPHLVISLIPFVNFPVSEACRKCNLPMLMITTDNDLAHWCYGLKRRRHNLFKVTIGRDLPTSKSVLLKARVPQNAIETIGLPLRPEFFHTASKAHLRKAYNIPQEREVVLIMMGGMGARSILRYVSTLAHSSLNIHLLVCAGKNHKLVEKLETIEPKNGNVVEIIPFTEKIYELFTIADLLITKPGPGTINEAQALKLPVLIDQMGTPLSWEKVNVQLVKDQKTGQSVRSLEELPALVHRFLRDEQTLENIVRSYEALPANQFAENIRLLVGEMILDSLEEELIFPARDHCISPSSV